MPWADLVAAIEPVYPKAEGPGRPPVGVERRLRRHCLHQWFNLSDPAVEEALYDSRALRQFVGIELGREPVPDETTIGMFRHLLDAHQVGEPLVAQIGAYWAAHGRTGRRGPLVDATRIAAASSTKNRTKERAPELHQTKKGHPWSFGMTGPSWRGQPDEADSFSGRDRRHGAGPSGGIRPAARTRNRTKSKVRAKVEPAFLVIKWIFG